MRPRGRIQERETSKGKAFDVITSFVDSETGKRKRSWQTVYSKKEAQKLLSSTLTQIDKNEFVNPCNWSVKKYLEQWIENNKARVEMRTQARYQGIVNNHLIPYLGSIKLSKLSPMQIQNYLNKVKETGINKKTGEPLSSASINYNYRVLRKALNDAVDLGILAANPAVKVKPPKETPQKPLVVLPFLPESQSREFLDACEADPVLRVPVILMLATGTRRGEVLALKWRDVDFAHNGILVHDSLERRKGEGLECKGRTKTRNGNRLVKISKKLSDFLAEVKNEQAILLESLGKDFHSENGFVCCWPDGRPIDPDLLSKHMRKIVKKHNISGLTAHALRHSHATYLLLAKVHPKVVQERLGHGEVRVTLDIYSHLIPDCQEGAAEVVDNIIFQNKNGVHNSVDGWVDSPCQATYPISTSL